MRPHTGPRCRRPETSRSGDLPGDRGETERAGLQSQRRAGLRSSRTLRPLPPASVMPPPVQVVMETGRQRAPGGGETPEALGRQRGQGGSEHLRPRPGRPPLCQVRAPHTGTRGTRGQLRKLLSSGTLQENKQLRLRVLPQENRNSQSAGRQPRLGGTRHVLWVSEPLRMSSGLSWNSHEP